MSDKPQEITLSIVVPVYNEQDGLEAFYGRLKAVAENLGGSYEILFINDGSTDNTGAILRRLNRDDPCVKIVEFSRNFGHQAAITAGYDLATGKAVITLDGDCQHPPEIIPDLVARWREGFEVVYTVRKGNKDVGVLHRLTVRLAYRVIRWFSGMDVSDQADFRLLDRKAVEAIKQHREAGRFVRGLVRHIGFRQTAVDYVAETRQAGRRTYTLGQSLRMAGAGMFNFSTVPLRLATTAGTILLAVAGADILYSLIRLGVGALSALTNLYFRLPQLLSPLALLMVFLSGLQLLALGLVGEYIGRIFEQVKARPLYIISEKTGFVASSKPAGGDIAPPSKRSDASDLLGKYKIFT